MQASLTPTYAGLRASDLAPTTSAPWLEIVVGTLFALCLVGLTHDLENLATGKDESAEAGRGIENIEAFHKNVNSAPFRRKAGFIGLLSLALYCLATAPRGIKLQNYTVLVLAVLCLSWLAASFLWSDNWRHTAREFVRVAAYAFVAVSMVLRFRPKQLCMVMVLAAFGSVMAACLASVLAGNFRPWEGDFRLHGTLHSNLLAHQALLVLLIAVALLPSAKNVWFWRAVLIAALCVILLTKTRGALVSAIVGVTAVKLIGRSMWSVAFAGSVLATLVLAAALLVVMGGSQVQERVEDTLTLGRSESVGTLTGRIPLWEAVWEESQGRRLRGYGYGAFWSVEMTEKMFKELKWYPRHSHSAYVHTILDLGYIGLGAVLALVAACLAAARRLYGRTQDVAYTFFFGFLATGLLDGFVEISYVSPRELGLFVGMAILALVVVHPEDETDPRISSESNQAADNLPLAVQPV